MDPSPVILVTGAEGFLGSHVVSAIKQAGHRVVAGVHSQAGSEENMAYLDICDPVNIKQVFDKYRPDYVIHCAAYGVNYLDRDVSIAINVNVTGSLNLLEIASGYSIKRFIHIGSCFEYGSVDGLVSEEVLPRPTDIYGSSKLAATVLMLERSSNLNISLLVLRPFGMWGPGEKPYRLVPQIVEACVNKTPLDMTPCKIARDYLYVGDMAGIIVKLCLLSDIENGLIINLGSGQPVELKDFVLSIARILKCEKLLNFGALEYRQTEMNSLVADTSLLTSILDEFHRTSLEEGLQLMLKEAKGVL
ncbi:MAG: NAD(P)-dependent oxidoreductase [Gammaproteobacteria bacterium]|nr:NAD(P)-dependent oxidoreductase [Gammaproteobacteria bacterium]